MPDWMDHSSTGGRSRNRTLLITLVSRAESRRDPELCCGLDTGHQWPLATTREGRLDVATDTGMRSPPHTHLWLPQSVHARAALARDEKDAKKRDVGAEKDDAQLSDGSYLAAPAVCLHDCVCGCEGTDLTYGLDSDGLVLTCTGSSSD